jgi:hypothetical protein
MQLNMSATVFQALPANDNVVGTGPMGDCVSVVVLFKLVDQTYQYVRGQHGLGGVESVDFGAILAGVPNTITSQVIVIPGSLQQSQFALESIRGILDDRVRTVARLDQVATRIVSGMSNANVDRQARVTQA